MLGLKPIGPGWTVGLALLVVCWAVGDGGPFGSLSTKHHSNWSEREGHSETRQEGTARHWEGSLSRGEAQA